MRIIQTRPTTRPPIPIRVGRTPTAIGPTPGGLLYIGPPIVPGAESNRNAVSPITIIARAIIARPTARPRCPLLMAAFVMRVTVGRVSRGRVARSTARGRLRHIQQGEIGHAFEAAADVDDERHGRLEIHPAAFAV